MTNQQHTTTSPVAVPAGGTHLAHFVSFCSCGFEIRSTFEQAVRRDALEHEGYMAAKAVGPKALRAYVRSLRPTF